MSHRKNTAEGKNRSPYFDEDLNPCVKEHHQSLNCMNDSAYDKEVCQPFFDNYKRCKEFWSHVTRIRRNKGMKPYLPPPEQRAKIKELYLKTGKIELNEQA